MNESYDIVIAGGGVVGCSAAIALSKHTDYSIAVIEAFDNVKANTSVKQADLAIANQSVEAHPSFDARVVALARESYKHLLSFGVDMSEVPSCAIQQIHVSDRGHIGQTRLQSQSDKETMGQVIALADLGKQLTKQIDELAIDLLCPYQIQGVERHQSYSQLTLRKNLINQSNQNNDELAENGASTSVQIRAKLVIIAEGGNAPSLGFFNIKHLSEDYAQHAIIANVLSQIPHQNTAFERFTEQGPVALLPMNAPFTEHKARATQSDHESKQLSLVWTCDEGEIESLLSLNDNDFLTRLQSVFGDKLGKFSACSPRFSYPLKLVKADNFVAHRAICLGNAAQSLHPIAGQGFNLGVRDIQSLVSVLSKQNKSEKNCNQLDMPVDPGAFSITSQYKKSRNADKAAVVMATDSLVRLFSNQYLPMVIGRNLGLVALNHAENMKNKLASFAMGKR